MRKEIIWAGAIGITFGLIIAFGVYRINSSLKTNNQNSQATPIPEPSSEFKITLDKPSDGDVVTDNTITVSGITKPLAWLTFSGEKGDYIVQSDEAGVFSQDVDLVPGVNQIKITAIDANKNTSTQKVLVVYSAAFQLNSVVSDSQATSDSAIRANVQAKVDQALNKPKAYIGVVTDIADSTIQIKTTASEIKQVSTNDGSTTVINTAGTNNKQVKVTDIAIGDFIVAMGYVNTSSVLSAQRILITDPLTDPPTDVKEGVVSDIPKKSVTIKTDVEVYANGTTKAAKFASLSPTQQIIYVTVVDASGNTSIRSIFVIS